MFRPVRNNTGGICNGKELLGFCGGYRTVIFIGEFSNLGLFLSIT